jgi:hypothetical protein
MGDNSCEQGLKQNIQFSKPKALEFCNILNEFLSDFLTGLKWYYSLL